MLTWSLVNSATSPVQRQISGTWDDLCKMLTSHEVSARKDGPGWMPADIAPGPRTSTRAGAWSVLVLDIEAKTQNLPDKTKRVIGPIPPDISLLALHLDIQQWSACLATSHSHEGPAVEGTLGPRYRVVLQLSRSLEPHEIRPMGLEVAKMLFVSDCLDTSCLEPARLFFLPRCPAERVELADTAIVKGSPLDVDDILHQCTEEASDRLSDRWQQADDVSIVNSNMACEVASPEVVRHLRSALNALRADDRKLWVDVGIALKTLGEQGRALWLDWSQTSDKYDPMEAARAWDSFKPSRIGYRFVFSKAKEQGWLNPMSKSDDRVRAALMPSSIDGDTAEDFEMEREKGFPFVHVRDLVSKPQVATYLIYDVIEHPALVLLFAPPASGKSFLAIAWAASVAAGVPWLGHDTRQGAVFYLAGEGHAGIGRRLRAWELHTGQSLEDVPLYVSETPAALMDAASVTEVIKAVIRLCTEHGMPALIVVDTFARNMGNGDENSNADVSLFIQHIDWMRKQLGCTVILVHHSGHGEKDRARGGSSLPAAMDASFRIDAKKTGLELVQVKSKEAELLEPMMIEIQQQELPGWQDSKGREMTSAVLVKREGGWPENQKNKPMNPKMQAAFSSFMRAANEHGEDDGVYLSVPLGWWRDEHYRTATEDTQDAKRKAFQRGRRDLVNDGWLTVENDIYRHDAFACCHLTDRSPGTHDKQDTGQPGQSRD